MPRLTDACRLTGGLAPVLLAVALGAAVIGLRWPGEPNNDSDLQYAQLLSGVYDDFYPPVMARFWSLLHLLGPGSGPIYAAHMTLYWAGYALLGFELQRRGRPWAGLLVVASGATPLLLMMAININSDTGLAACLLCLVGLWLRARRVGGWSPATVALGVLLFAYATLVRTNAVFATAPLLVLAFRRGAEAIRPVRVLLASVVVAALLIPLGVAVNRHVLVAKPGGALTTLQLFDLTGVARLSGDLSVLPDPAELGRGRRCYSPVMWDTIKSRCPALAEATQPRPDLTRLWLTGIAAHPLAYAEHRLLNANSAFYAYVPPFHVQLARMDRDDGPDYTNGKNPLVNLARFIPLLSPLSMALLALGLLAVARAAPDRLPDDQRYAAFALVASSLLYAAAFEVVNVASEQRYFLWPTMATLCALIVLWPVVRARLRARDPRLLLLIATLVATNTLQVYARATRDVALTAR